MVTIDGVTGETRHELLGSDSGKGPVAVTFEGQITSALTNNST